MNSPETAAAIPEFQLWRTIRLLRKQLREGCQSVVWLAAMELEAPLEISIRAQAFCRTTDLRSTTALKA